MRAVPEEPRCSRLPGRPPHANLPHPTRLRRATFSREREKERSRRCRVPPRTSDHQLERARKLRREQTRAEEILWRSLRDRQLGVKFRRQVPIGALVVDFACVEAKVVVEVDGPSHETDEGAARDTGRDAMLRRDGWRVVRVTNALVTSGGDLALEAIRAAMKEKG